MSKAPATATPRELGTDEERAERNALICAAADRGITHRTLAQQYGLTKRQIINIVKGERERHHMELVSDADPMTFIQETLGQFEAGIEELAMLSATTDQPSVKVAAIRARIETIRGRLELLQAIGVIPHNLGTIKVESDAREVAKAIMDVLEAYGIPEPVQDAILSVVSGEEVELPDSVIDGMARG